MANIDRRTTVRVLWLALEQAPEPMRFPPCFSTRTQWVEFLEEAATFQRPPRVRGPLHLDPTGTDRPRFNLGFNFCSDCDAAHKALKTAAGRCDPNHLIRTIGGSHAGTPSPSKPSTPSKQGDQ